MEDVTVSPEGKITLPKSALEALSLKPGDQVRFFVYGHKVKILADETRVSALRRPATRRPAQIFRRNGRRHRSGSL